MLCFRSRRTMNAYHRWFELVPISSSPRPSLHRSPRNEARRLYATLESMAGSLKG